MVYIVLDVCYSGVIMPVIIGVKISRRVKHVSVVVNKKNFTSKRLSLNLLSIFYYDLIVVRILALLQLMKIIIFFCHVQQQWRHIPYLYFRLLIQLIFF